MTTFIPLSGGVRITGLIEAYPTEELRLEYIDNHDPTLGIDPPEFGIFENGVTGIRELWAFGRGPSDGRLLLFVDGNGQRTEVILGTTQGFSGDLPSDYPQVEIRLQEQGQTSIAVFTWNMPVLFKEEYIEIRGGRTLGGVASTSDQRIHTIEIAHPYGNEDLSIRVKKGVVEAVEAGVTESPYYSGDTTYPAPVPVATPTAPAKDTTSGGTVSGGTTSGSSVVVTPWSDFTPIYDSLLAHETGVRVTRTFEVPVQAKRIFVVGKMTSSALNNSRWNVGVDITFSPKVHISSGNAIWSTMKMYPVIAGGGFFEVIEYPVTGIRLTQLGNGSLPADDSWDFDIFMEQ